jgi:hypothetical protein
MYAVEEVIPLNYPPKEKQIDRYHHQPRLR